MHLDFFAAAFLLGIVVAIPPGSVTIIAVQRALRNGIGNSLLFTAGSSCSDIFYLILVYFGAANIAASNRTFKIILWFVSGAILIGMAVVSFISVLKSRGKEPVEKKIQSRRLTTFISGILVTLTNPMTVVGWIAVAGNFFLIWNEKCPDIKKYGILTVFVIMLGVLTWFVPLILIIHKIGKLLKGKITDILVTAGNAFLLAFGILAFYYAVKTALEL